MGRGLAPTRRETATPMHLGQSCGACGAARLLRAKVTQQRRALAISTERETGPPAQPSHARAQAPGQFGPLVPGPEQESQPL